MKFGFVKTAVCSLEIKVADTAFNAGAIIEKINGAHKEGAELILFPELCITGSTCGDLFFSDLLLSGAIDALDQIREASRGLDSLIFVGMPIKKSNVLYDVAVAVNNGKILAVIPKTVLTQKNEIADLRYFAPCPYDNDTIELLGTQVPFGSKIILQEKSNQNFTVCAEIGSDLFAPLSPSTYHALNGANVVVNLCAFSEAVGGKEFRAEAVKNQSSKNACAYLLACAGRGESTSDCVYGGQKIVAECGNIISDSGVFSNDMIITEIDVDYISAERTKTFATETVSDGYERVIFTADKPWKTLTRKYAKTPFVPEKDGLKERAEEVLNIQAEGLYKRLKHTGAQTAVLGLSGGLDSTLAILVAVTAMKKLNRPLKDIVAVTMPCFGTTSRTFQNTLKLAKALGTTLKKVDITKSVLRHLKDINHSETVYDAAYENAQARERTQVLMDMANMTNGLVIGTGDLSELALGWATYNGDHMSMYAVNCSVPKTLVRHVVEQYAKTSKGKLKAVLSDILDTPVSPELLPAENDDIAQKTEDIVGPYILHDFFLYNMVRKGFAPDKIYYIACNTFKGDFKEQTILKWLKIFVRRFFNQQFKRSCVPDGVKVGTVTLSPRGDWKMPSDAVSALWLKTLENL